MLAAGEAAFLKRGFHRTSLDQVAAAAGYTKGAVYSNFASKEDLFLAIYERRVERSLERVEQGLSGGGEDGAVELARRHLATPDRGWMAVFFEFWAHVLRSPRARERFLDLHRRAQQPLIDHARDRLPSDGGLDAEAWTLSLVAMVNGLQLEQLTDPRLEAVEVATAMIEAAERGAR